jgi:glycosyltransferase involved in cell wall biosynthesis
MGLDLNSDQPDSRSVQVSIGVPVYNGALGLADALDSLVNQTVRDIEIIISDNASTDTTPEICRRYTEQDPRIVYYRQPATVPPVENFLFVLGKARAPYFMWAAHDDVRSLEFVEKLLAAFEANRRAVLAFGDFVDMRRDGAVPAKSTSPEPGAPRWRRLWAMAFSRFHYAYGLWKTDVLRSVPWVHNGWWPDLPLMMSASMLGDFVRVPGAELRYRVRDNARYFELPPKPGISGYLSNFLIRLRRAWHMARAPVLAAASVGRVAGIPLGLFAGILAWLKVAYSAAGYFWHWLRVQIGLLPRPGA